MSMSLQMLQMKSAPKCAVDLHSFDFQAKDSWTCTAEGQNDGIAFKIIGVGDTPAAAVDECHAKWLKLTDRMPELIGALPAPTDYQNADHMVEPIDDDIPF